MLKEAELLEVLRQEKADIGLIVIKDMLDTQFSIQKEGVYAAPYVMATEEEKWLFAKRFTEKLSRNILFWDDYLDSQDFQEAYHEVFGAD